MNVFDVALRILSALPMAAQSPLGLTAFCISIVGAIVYTIGVLKVQEVERKASLIPEGQRLDYLSRELGKAPYLAHGMTAMQFIAAERMRRLYNIVILVIAFLFVLLAVAAYYVFADGELDGRISRTTGCLVISCAEAETADFAADRRISRTQSEGPDGKLQIKVTLKYIEDVHSGIPVPFLNPAEIASDIDPALESASFKVNVQHNNNSRSLAQISGARITLQKFTPDDQPVLIFDENSWFTGNQKFIVYNIGWGEVIDPVLVVKLFDKSICHTSSTHSSNGMETYVKYSGDFARAAPISTSTIAFNGFKQWQRVLVPKPDDRIDYCADVVMKYSYNGREVSSRFLGTLHEPDGLGDKEVPDRTYRGALPTKVGDSVFIRTPRRIESRTSDFYEVELTCPRSGTYQVSMEIINSGNRITVSREIQAICFAINIAGIKDYFK